MPPEPKDHFQKRGAVESLLRQIPGFRGYLEQEYRRDSDRLQRQWLADRLERSKRGLNDLALRLTDLGALNLLPNLDRARARLDKVQGRIRGAMSGYSGFFDLVQIDEDDLDQVYEFDVNLMDQVSDLADSVEGLGGKEPDQVAEALAAVQQGIQELDKAWDQRQDMLSGLD